MGTKKKTILLAEDEEHLRALVAATLLGDDRYELLIAKDGEEAMDKAFKAKPDLVLLDIVMPKRQGWDVCEALKRDSSTRRVKVVFLSALAQDSHKRKARAMGADAFLTKPFSPVELQQVVDSLLATR